jgi:hypothetical protein
MTPPNPCSKKILNSKVVCTAGMIAFTVICTLCAVLVSSIERHSINVSIAEVDGATTVRTFAPKSKDSAGLLAEAAEFCTAVSAITESCDITLVEQYMMSLQHVTPLWNNSGEIAGRFTDDVVSDYCRSPQVHGFTNHDECSSMLRQAIRGTKLVHAYQASYRAADLISKNTLIPMTSDWGDTLEGNSFYYVTKVEMLQNFADDARVVRICEVGFNMGHSVSLSQHLMFLFPVIVDIRSLQAINWLISNPVAEVLSFDIVRTRYAAAAINAVHELFPRRVLNLVVGDSAFAVPNFSRFLYGDSDGDSSSERNTANGPWKYNLIFIDGNHEYEGALLDIINFKPYANQTYHRIIVDDGLYPDVRRAWDYAVHTLGIVRTVSIEAVKEASCMNGTVVESGPLKGTTKFVPCSADGILYHFDDLIIGEYV